MDNNTLSPVIHFPVPLDQLITAISDKVKQDNADLLQDLSTKKQSEELLTRKQAAGILGVTLPTLLDWTRNGVIIGYRIGHRIRYKRSEIENSLIQIRTVKKNF